MSQDAPAARVSGWRARTPNALTGARLIMTIACVACLSLYDGRDAAPSNATLAWCALLLYLIASITDALDGHLARRWNAVTRFGRVMDPLADKVLVLGVFIVLAGPNFTDTERLPITGVLPWMPVVCLTRELLVTSLRATYESAGVDFSATVTGKLKMGVQTLGNLVILSTLVGIFAQASGDETRAIAVRVNEVVAWTITLVTALSALPYLRKAFAATRPRTSEP